MCGAWVEFLDQRTKRWSALRDQLGRCDGVEEAMKAHTDFMTEAMGAYSEAASSMMGVARKALGDVKALAGDVAPVAPTRIEERRAA